MTDTSNAPTKAAVNVVTENPLMIFPRNQNNAPFTTREKNPRVTMLSGSVRMLMTGLMNILKSVRHAPTISATQIGSTLIPETTWVVIHTAAESMIQCKMSFIMN